MPELVFKGKEFVYNHHLAVPVRPLEPIAEKSIGPARLDGNLIIHGDNLHALKALLPTHAGKIDCVFIDPPYNTGNEGWSYNDNSPSDPRRGFRRANGEMIAPCEPRIASRARWARLSRSVFLVSDTLSPSQRSERMSRIRSKDSKPELALRRLVHGLGYRYRLHRRDLPGTPDMVFPARRKVIFMHSCFWHRHPDPLCRLARLPKSRKEFWIPKLEENRRRDLDNERRLKELGWESLVVWECQIRDVEGLTRRVKEFLDQ